MAGEKATERMDGCLKDAAKTSRHWRESEEEVNGFLTKSEIDQHEIPWQETR